MKKNIILGLILGIFIFGCVQEPIACTEDAKVCPDGSTVSRNPDNNCEFDLCPGENDGLDKCETDLDCIPLPSECHPRICINKKYEDNYVKPEICTMMHDPEAAYVPEDCICQQNKCVNKNKIAGMNLEEAKEIAQNSVCTEEGELTENAFYNENTKTWWIDLELEKEGCAPACVVNVATKTAEINWRCTGALPPEEKSENIIIKSTPQGDLKPDTRDPKEVCINLQNENNLGSCKLIEFKTSQDQNECFEGGGGMSPAGCFFCKFECS